MALDVHDADEIERGLTAFAAEQNGGVLVTPHALTLTNRDLIVALAARLRLPALYPLAFYAKAGGLISYGFDPVNQFQQAAGYVDRILRGAKPADLPVQYPTKLQLVINLETAKALGLAIPESFLLRADEVIELLLVYEVAQPMPGRRAKILSTTDVGDLLTFASCTRRRLRITVMVLLSAKAELRAGEIANLTWDMVLDATGQISGLIELADTAAKKCSGRSIPLHPDLAAALAAWRQVAPPSHT